MRLAKNLALYAAGLIPALLLFAGQPNRAVAAPECPSVGGVITDGSVCPQVAVNGVGDLLIYSFWQTSNGRDTLFTINEAFGSNSRTFVHVRFREGVNSIDVLDFTICLSPGDVWTAALTAGTTGHSVLIVGNPGSCDDDVHPPLTPPPAPGEELIIANATFGYIEAYTFPGTLGGDPGDDSIFGTATIVNPASGFSSSYNATALVNFNGASETDTAHLNPYISAALAREGGVDKEILMTRYTAGGSLNAVSQIVLTFPTGEQPFIPANGPDPVSAYFFDENENINSSPRRIDLPWEVNVCTIERTGTPPLTTITCPGTGNGFIVQGGGGTYTGGWVRLFNNKLDALDTDSIDAAPASRFAVIGFSASFFEGLGGEFDQLFPIQWAAAAGSGGADISCPNFPAIGLDTTPFPTANLGACNSFNTLSGTYFAPWYTNDGANPSNKVLIVPGNNTGGALPYQ